MNRGAAGVGGAAGAGRSARQAPDHAYFSTLIWQIADLLRGPYRPPQYERVMLPMTVLRRFDCVLAPTKARVLAEYERRKGGRLRGEALDSVLNRAAGQRFHNRSPLDFEKLQGDPDHIAQHLVSYIQGFSADVRRIFVEHFEFEAEIEKMRESHILYMIVSQFRNVDLHPDTVPNEQMGLIFENLIRRFNELANETAGDHFTPREVIKAAYWTGGTIPWLNSSGVVNQSEVTGTDQFVTAYAVQECHLPLVKAGSVLIAITGQGETRGRAVVLSIDSTINQHLAFIQPERSRLRPWFLRWTLFAAYDFLRSISDDAGGTKGALTCEEVANLRVPIPPSDEQAAILDHIAAFTGRFDLLQSTAERTIAIIKERRATLIAAAVTGQLDVGSAS